MKSTTFEDAKAVVTRLTLEIKLCYSQGGFPDGDLIRQYNEAVERLCIIAVEKGLEQW